MKRNPAEDWLPHCISCDGRHTNKETCEEFLARLRVKSTA